jgi:hypothetical protein
MNLRIEKLQRGLAVEGFDCGQEALNRFLIRHALQNEQAGASRTYVALADAEIAGYYTLVVGQVEHTAAPERLKKGLARHPVPIMLLARLAVALAGERSRFRPVEGRHAPHTASRRHCGHTSVRRPCEGRQGQGIL